MKKLSFKIDVYDWDVYLYQLEAKDTEKDVIKVLQKHNIPVDKNEDLLEDVKAGSYDGGWTFRTSGQSISVVIFQRFSSENAKNNVYFHEKRHVEDDIIERLQMYDESEAAAYLAGYLSLKFLELSKQVTTYKKLSNGKNKKKR